MKPLEQRFSQFYERWIWKLEQILHELVEVIRHRNEVLQVNVDAQLQALLSKVTCHIKEFYTMKWAEARENCLPFFSPIWLSPLENAYLWVTGFKPSMVYGLIDTMKNPRTRVPVEPFVVTAEQGRKIEELRIRTKMEEEKVEREMERIQMSMADQKMVELAKLTVRVQNGDVTAALEGVIGGLEKAMKGADCVRLKALKGVLDVMTPMQGVEFLAAFLTVQLRLRLWGKRRVLLMGTREVELAPN